MYKTLQLFKLKMVTRKTENLFPGENQFGYIIIENTTHQLLNNLLDQLAERVTRVLYPEMVNELRDYFRVGFTLEAVPPLLKQRLHFLVICHDTCEGKRELTERGRDVVGESSGIIVRFLPLCTTTKPWSMSDLWGCEFTSDGTP